MNPKQALNNLYQAVRSVNANAETHEALSQCYKVVFEALVDTDKKEK